MRDLLAKCSGVSPTSSPCTCSAGITAKTRLYSASLIGLSRDSGIMVAPTFSAASRNVLAYTDSKTALGARRPKREAVGVSSFSSSRCFVTSSTPTSAVTPVGALMPLGPTPGHDWYFGSCHPALQPPLGQKRLAQLGHRALNPPVASISERQAR